MPPKEFKPVLKCSKVRMGGDGLTGNEKSRVKVKIDVKRSSTVR